MSTLSNVEYKKGCKEPICNGAESIAPLILDENGVSTRNAHMCPPLQENVSVQKSWYAMRASYGREKKAYEYVISHGGTAFYPTCLITKVIGEKRTTVEVSRIPNVFFIFGTEEEVKYFAYDNVHLPFLRFYYGHKHEGVNIIKYPLIIPESQMRSLMIVCSSSASDTMIVPSSVKNFTIGEEVTVVEGEFKGVVGRVSRWHGQQRVGIIIDGLCTIATAYIPSAFLKKIT